MLRRLRLISQPLTKSEVRCKFESNIRVGKTRGIGKSVRERILPCSTKELIANIRGSIGTARVLLDVPNRDILEPLNQSYLTVACICFLDNVVYLHMREHTPYTLMNNVHGVFLIKHSYFIARDSSLLFFPHFYRMALKLYFKYTRLSKELYLAAYQNYLICLTYRNHL